MRDKVIRKLAKKSYSSWELKKKCADIPDIEAIVADLADKGYLNDKEWLSSFVRQGEAKGLSPLAIASKMRNKGIPRDVIEEALNTLDSEEALKRAIAKKMRGKTPDRQKLIASLLRQGFSWEQVSRESFREI